MTHLHSSRALILERSHSHRSLHGAGTGCRYFVIAFGSSAHVSAPNTPTRLGLTGPTDYLIPHACPLQCFHGVLCSFEGLLNADVLERLGARRCVRHVVATGDARDQHLGMNVAKDAVNEVDSEVDRQILRVSARDRDLRCRVVDEEYEGRVTDPIGEARNRRKGCGRCEIDDPPVPCVDDGSLLGPCVAGG